jgi:hypothetical protein
MVSRFLLEKEKEDCQLEERCVSARERKHSAQRNLVIYGIFGGRPHENAPFCFQNKQTRNHRQKKNRNKTD